MVYDRIGNWTEVFQFGYSVTSAWHLHEKIVAKLEVYLQMSLHMYVVSVYCKLLAAGTGVHKSAQAHPCIHCHNVCVTCMLK